MSNADLIRKLQIVIVRLCFELLQLGFSPDKLKDLLESL